MMPVISPKAESPQRFLEAWHEGRVGGLRVVALAEAVCLLVALVAADLIWFDGTRFANVAPHPFWAVVLLVAVQYGTAEGLATAALSSVALLVGNLPAQSLGADLFDWQTTLIGRPIMWLAAAIIVGELVNRHRRRLIEQTASLNQSERARTDLDQKHESLIQAHQKLELAVASDLHSELALQRSASQLYGGTVQSVIEGAREVLSSTLKPEKFSLYVLDGPRLRLIHAEGWSNEDWRPKQYASGDPIFDHIVARRADLSVNRPTDQAILGNDGLLAGALTTPGEGQVLGMLKVEGLPFAAFTYVSLANFRAVCDLIAAALANVSRLQKPPAKAEPSIAAAPPSFRLDACELCRPLQAVAAAQNFGLHAIEIFVAPNAALSGSGRRELSEAVEQACRRLIPQGAIVGTSGAAATDLLVLLPGMSAAETTALARTIEQGLGSAISTGNDDWPIFARTRCLHEVATPDAMDASGNVVPFQRRDA